MKQLSYIIIILTTLCVGCRTLKQIKVSTDVQKSKDSVNVFESVIQEKKRAAIKADSAQTEISLRIEAVKSFSCLLPHCFALRDTIISNTSGRATQTTIFKGGTFTSKCKCDTAAIEYTVENRLRREFNSHLNDNKTTVAETKTVEVPYYPLWIRILAGIGVAGLIYATIRIIYFLKI